MQFFCHNVLQNDDYLDILKFNMNNISSILSEIMLIIYIKKEGVRPI